jgi:hypothetical protein
MFLLGSQFRLWTQETALPRLFFKLEQYPLLMKEGKRLRTGREDRIIEIIVHRRRYVN